MNANLFSLHFTLEPYGGEYQPSKIPIMSFLHLTYIRQQDFKGSYSPVVQPWKWCLPVLLSLYKTESQAKLQAHASVQGNLCKVNPD